MSKQEMLVNYVRGEECRIAIVEDGKLEEYYSERASADLHVGNIYRGVVRNVEPSFQAAFVDFGLERAGFLHITDLHPSYFPGDKHEDVERVGHKTPRRERPPIQQCLRRGQEILVQVLKEGISGKGPTLTSYLSIPGRFLVMMPHMERHGVSRKIEDPEKRKQIHRILDELDPPDGFGFIVRTAGLDRPKTELKRDLAYLLRVWKDIEGKMKHGRGPAELNVESDLITRTLRDVVSTDVKMIIVDDREVALRAKQFIRLATPRSTTQVIHYSQPVPLFDAFDVERQIQTIHDRVITLDSGVSMVFDSTEAIVAVDVNSGKFRDHKDAEMTAFKTNMEAVDEIARQLRLRDLGGIIVLDLIDMYQLKHRREVEKRFKENLKKDRAKTHDMKISELGLLELTRQRMRPSLHKSAFRECPSCGGAGKLMSLESVVLDVMRRLSVAIHTEKVARMELAASAEVIAALLNRRRAAITQLEVSSGKKVNFVADAAAGLGGVKLTAYDEHDKLVEPSHTTRVGRPRIEPGDEISLDDVKEFEKHAGIPDDFEAEVESDTESKTEAESQREAQREEQQDTAPQPGVTPAPHPVESTDGQPTGRKRRRRRGRRGGANRNAPNHPTVEPLHPGGYEAGPAAPEPAVESVIESGPMDVVPSVGGPSNLHQPGHPQHGDEPGTGRRRRRRRGGRRHRRGRGGGGGAPGEGGGEGQSSPNTGPTT